MASKKTSMHPHAMVRCRYRRNRHLPKSRSGREDVQTARTWSVLRSQAPRKCHEVTEPNISWQSPAQKMSRNDRAEHLTVKNSARRPFYDDLGCIHQAEQGHGPIIVLKMARARQNVKSSSINSEINNSNSHSERVWASLTVI